MHWEEAVEQLKKINPEHLGEKSLLDFKMELQKYLEQVSKELDRRI